MSRTVVPPNGVSAHHHGEGRVAVAGRAAAWHVADLSCMNTLRAWASAPTAPAGRACPTLVSQGGPADYQPFRAARPRTPADTRTPRLRWRAWRGVRTAAPGYPRLVPLARLRLPVRIPSQGRQGAAIRGGPPRCPGSGPRCLPTPAGPPTLLHVFGYQRVTDSAVKTQACA
jgi:hypothetical protein